MESSSLEVELEEKNNCCEELETTCLDLQLQIESALPKETPKLVLQQEEKRIEADCDIAAASAKLVACQETIVNLGKQLLGERRRMRRGEEKRLRRLLRRWKMVVRQDEADGFPGTERIRSDCGLGGEKRTGWLMRATLPSTFLVPAAALLDEDTVSRSRGETACAHRKGGVRPEEEDSIAADGGGSTSLVGKK